MVTNQVTGLRPTTEGGVPKSALLPKPRKRRWEEGALARDRPASTTAGREKFLKETARFRRRSSPVNGGHAAPAIAAARAQPSQSAGPGPPGARQPPRANRPPSPAPSLPAQRPRMRLRQPAARGAAAPLLPPPLPPPPALRPPLPPSRRDAHPQLLEIRHFIPPAGASAVAAPPPAAAKDTAAVSCNILHWGAALDAAAVAAAAPPPPPGPSRDLRGGPAPGARRPRPSRRPQPTVRGLPPERPPRASGGGLSPR